MPTTLNALIRYKTINSCLYGGKRRWSIQELLDACSEALADSRGRYASISERTLRDDLRVMKSDILGFNAPIEQEKGLYYYSDPHYSIFTLTITDPELAARILAFLLKLRDQIKHPELESVLALLGKLASRPAVSKPMPKWSFHIETDSRMDNYEKSDKIVEIFQIPPSQERRARKSVMVNKLHIQKTEFSWGDVFEKILLLTS